MQKIVLFSVYTFIILILISCNANQGDTIQKNENKDLIQEEIETNLTQETSSHSENITPIIEEEIQVEIPEYLQILRDGSNFTFENILADNIYYTRYQISYVSEWLKISGIMNIPKNISNAPLLILNHGYIDTSVYTLWRWLKREQDYFARNWFAVIHPDYRNHAFSEVDQNISGTGNILRSKKYGIDSINAIIAVQKAQKKGEEKLIWVDSETVWMLWHSMGGWVTMFAMVAAPDLIDAAVLYAPVHSNEYYNYERWSSSRLTNSEKELLSSQMWDLSNPENFIPISPENYFGNIQAPIQIYFWTQDQSCPVIWGTDIKSALESENKKVELIIYDGEQHEFGARWNDFMKWSKIFFDKSFK